MIVTTNAIVGRNFRSFIEDIANWTAYKISPAYQKRRKSRRISTLLSHQRFAEAETALFKILKYAQPSNKLLIEYTLVCILKKKTNATEDLINSEKLNSNQRKFLIVSLHYLRGDFHLAVQEMEGFKSDSDLLNAEILRIRYLIARQTGEDLTAASLGVTYMQTKVRPDIGVTASLITLGERLNDSALISMAIAAAMKDAHGTKRNEVLFAENWERLIHFWLTMFDVEAALSVARRAIRLGFKKARRARGLVNAIISDTEEIQHLIDQARSQLVDLSEGRQTAAKSESFTLIVASAILNYRKHDPESFRPSLRLIYKEIVKALRDHEIEPNIVVKIDSRSEIGTEVSNHYISYHTTSAKRNGLHFKEAYYPGTFSFDRNGYSGWSEIADYSLLDLKLDEYCPPEEVETFYQGLKAAIAANSSKYKQSAISDDTNIPKRFVFVGLQVISDSVQKLARIPMLDMLDEVASANAARGIATVVKRHPLCRSALVRETLLEGEKNDRWFVSSASVHDLLARSSGVCVVNSGVGIEALAHLKPVYLFGKADYRHVCYDMMRPGDYARIFREDVLPVEAEIIKKYLYYFRNRNLIDLQEPETAAIRIRQRLDQYLDGIVSEMNTSVIRK